MGNNLDDRTSAVVASSEMLNIVNNLIEVVDNNKNSPIAIMPLSNNHRSAEVVSTIASTIASYARKVILIDALTDGNFEICTNGQDGLFEYIVEDEDLEKCIIKNANLSYDIMPSGNMLNGIELAHHADFEAKITALYKFYDVVFVCVTKAFDGVTASIANKIGQTMIIIDKSIDNKRDLITAKNSLSNFIGAVILKSTKRTFKQWLNTKSK